MANGITAALEQESCGGQYAVLVKNSLDKIAQVCVDAGTVFSSPESFYSECMDILFGIRLYLY